MTQTAMAVPRGYYGGSHGARVARWVLRSVERLWPAAARHLGVRLFSTPLPLKWRQRRRAWVPGWHTERWAFELRSLTIYSAIEHGADTGRPLALLAHGWGGHARQMLPLASALAGAGWRPVIVEMPAHGRSDGFSSSLPQFARALEYVTARLREEGEVVDVVVAHSLGANAAAYSASRGHAPQRLVLLAPPASPRAYTQLFAQAFGLTEATRAAVQRHVEAREGILMSHFEPTAVGPRISSRTLVVHDRGDRINRFADGEAFSRSIAGARLLATDGLGHRGVLKDAAVVRAVVAFCGTA